MFFYDYTKNILTITINYQTIQNEAVRMAMSGEGLVAALANISDNVVAFRNVTFQNCPRCRR